MGRCEGVHWYGSDDRRGAVVGATASVYKNVEPWTVVGGNPARVIKKREIIDD